MMDTGFDVLRIRVKARRKDRSALLEVCGCQTPGPAHALHGRLHVRRRKSLVVAAARDKQPGSSGKKHEAVVIWSPYA